MTAKQPYVARSCQSCETPIPATARADAIYCSGTCRSRARKDRDRTAHRARRAAWHARRGRWLRHGLDPDVAEAMLEFGCAACGVAFANPVDAKVDHDHSCCPGEYGCAQCVRGLLCSGCNIALGCVRDNPERLRALADYLERRA